MSVTEHAFVFLICAAIFAAGYHLGRNQGKRVGLERGKAMGWNDRQFKVWEDEKARHGRDG